MLKYDYVVTTIDRSRPLHHSGSLSPCRISLLALYVRLFSVVLHRVPSVSAVKERDERWFEPAGLPISETTLGLELCCASAALLAW